MDGSNWRSAAPGGEAPVDRVDWRTQLLHTVSRQHIVNKIIEFLKRHILFSGPEGLQEIKKIAERFEDGIYSTASSQPDYLQKISHMMLNLENRSQNTIQNTGSMNPASNINRLPDTGVSHSLPSHVQNPSQAYQQMVSQNVQNNTAPGGVQISTGLNTSWPSVPPQQRTQAQNPQYLYQQQQLESPVPKFQPGNPSQQLMQSHNPQQRQNPWQVNQFQSSQQLGMQNSGVVQPSLMQPASMTGLQQNQPSIQHSALSMLQQHQQQSVTRQQQQQKVLSSLTKTGTPLQSASSPFIVPSPSTPLAPSPMPGDSEKPLPSLSNVSHQQALAPPASAPAPSLAVGTPGISASPLLEAFTGTDCAHAGALTTNAGKSNVVEQPVERLLKAVQCKSLSPKALSASVSDIGSVVSVIDRIAGSAPGNGSKATVGEDLVAMTKCHLQARICVTQDGISGTRKMRRCASAMPMNVVSSVGSMSDSFKHLTGPEASDLEPLGHQANHVLMEEIREINQLLIDTVVDISDEDTYPVTVTAKGGEGTVVRCSFSAVALSPYLKSQYASAQMSPIQPLRLLIPANYPNSSPILLDKLPVEVSKEYEDLSAKAKSMFSLSQPMSLSEIARTWDICTRAVVCEHAQQSGGGTFSSKYGAWESCLNAL